MTALLLKEVLRVNGLNKPFTGGIGSFVLVIMVYSILHCSDHLNGKDYFSQIMCIANFMQHDFEPFVTLITSVKMSKLAASADLDLNIEDPRTHCLLVTSAYKIKAIVTAFSRFRYSLSAVEEEFYKIGHNEKKKQKKIFFESMDSFMVNPVADI